ncbi:MAG TPA: L-histidine N(alpha)-methyltransferase [Gammaproteobacteria bacterium]|nr:L-histidine N(alpha)-methyltransferase [Gammaproteobacteria bacterium]
MSNNNLGTTDTELDLLDLHPTRTDLKADVLYGLRQPQKWISSMYFYDERGSQLFDEICELPEYYPTRTEIGIMENDADEMGELLGPNVLLVEFGSGSSIKIRLLLEHLHRIAAYVPVEISREHLMNSARELQDAYPEIAILPVCADFTAPFDLPEPPQPARRTVVYFPGSTIGNFEPPDALELLRHMRRIAGNEGALLIGVDLKKDVSILERAYDDSAGVTAAFNKNVLARLNRELGADFDLDHFHHRAVWNESHSRIEMHLVSDQAQSVHIGGDTISFEKDEYIHTESSYKYLPDEFAQIAGEAGFSVEHVWRDSAGLFSVQYLESE